MNRYLKEKWLHKLRSGEIKQANGTLCNSDGNKCCLGVLAEVMGAVFFVPIGQVTSYTKAFISTGIEVKVRDGQDSEAEFLSKDMLKLCGLTEEEQSILAKMNDVGKTFVEIADYIETNIKGDEL